MAQVFDLRNILTEAFKKTGVEWHIKGVLNGKGNLYTFSDDTKLISKVFELVSFPVIVKAMKPEKHRIALLDARWFQQQSWL